MGITDTGRLHMLKALADHILYANIYCTGNIKILRCPVQVLFIELQAKISVLIDAEKLECLIAGVVDLKTLFVSYLLVHDALSLYVGLLQHKTKPAGSGFIIKLTITFEV